jgi:hypothetical protein
MNAQIRQFCAVTPGAVLVDLIPAIQSSIYPAITFLAGLSDDGVHLSAAGAVVGGSSFGAIISPLVTPGAPVSPVLTGNLVTNAGFSIASGGSVGSGNSGALPLGFTGLNDNANVSCAFSLNLRGDGTQEIVGVATANSSNVEQGLVISQSINVAGLTAGQIIKAGAQIDVDNGYSGLFDVRGEMDAVFSDSSTASTWCMENGAGLTGLAAGGGALLQTLQTNPLPLPASTPTISSLVASWGVRFKGAGACTFRIRNPWTIAH